MKNKFTLLALLACSVLYSQTWKKSISDPYANFNDIEQSFLNWRDSVQNSIDQHSNSLFHHNDIAEQKEMLEEAGEQFYNWEGISKNQFGSNGNRISSMPDHIQSAQGTWISRGPVNLVGSGAGSYGIGRMQCIAINQADTNIIYAISQSGTLWKSPDDGNHWNVLIESSSTFSFAYIQTDPVNGSILYAVISGNLNKSTDGGNSWAQLNNGFALSSFKLLVDPSNNQHLLLTAYQHGINESTDGGITWTGINSYYYQDIEFNPQNPSVVFGIGASNTVGRSNDGGHTFVNSATIPVNYGMDEIAITNADTSYVYVLSVDGNYHGQVAVSTDGGMTFTVRPVSANMLDGVSYHFEVSPLDKNLIIHAGLRCSRSTDGGLTWNWAASQYSTQTNPPYEHVDNRFVIFNKGSFWSCNDGGVYKSVNGGLNWIDKTAGMAISNFNSLETSETDTSVFGGGTWDNSILIHQNAGWSDLFLGDGFNIAIHPTNPLVIYGKNQYNFARTLNGNTTSSATFFIGLTESIYGFQSSYPIKWNHQNVNSMYLLANNVWKSTDNGTHVTQISNFTSNSGGGFLYVCSSDSNIIYTSYYHTLNNGTTWIPNAKKVICVDPDEPNKVWGRNSATETFGIFYSSDGGTTWTSIPSSDLNLTYNSALNMRCANNTHNGVYLFTGSSIYYLDDRLSNWQNFNNGLPDIPVSDMNVLQNYGKIRISTNGRGIWESNLFDSTQSLSVNFIADKYSVCPNDTVHFYDNSQNNGPGYTPVYQWLFPGGNPSFSSAANPRVVYNSSGNYNVTLIVSNTNGIDTLTQSLFIHVNTAPLVSTPFSEGFDPPSTFPPVNWNVNHYSSMPLWIRSLWANSGGYAHSQKSLEYLYNQGSASTNDYFTTPYFNLSSVFDPILVFDYCYPFDTLNPDTFKIFYTTDCGLTKNYIYTRGGQNLKTVLQGCCVIFPDSTMWKTDTLHLFPIQFLGDIQFGLEVFGKGMCTVYIDNINIESGPGTPLGTPPVPGENNIQFFPNPANDKITVNYSLPPETTNPVLNIYDTSGRLLLQQLLSSTKQSTSLSIAGLPEGLYFCNIVSENTVLKTGKVAVVR